MKLDPFLTSYLVPGWCWPSEIRAIHDIVKSVKSEIHVEIGSFCGKSLFPAAKAITECGKIYSIDPLENIDGLCTPDWQWVLDVNKASMQAVQRLRPDIILRPIKDYSINAARIVYEKVCSVYIDGNHGYEAFSLDLETWIPKIRPGGVIFGHDFRNPEWPAVERTIQELDRPFEIVPQTRVWKIQL